MKRTKIQQLKRENPEMSSTEIAEEVGSSAGYVRQVWNDDDASAEPSSRDRDRGDDPIDELRGEPGDVDPVDEALSELVIDDEYDEYECDECGGTLEYLEPVCPECESEPAWWAL